MKHRQSGCSQAAASAKADISIRSGRRVEKGEIARQGERHWRTRKDPFKAVWDSELVPILEKEPSLTGITLWDYLDERYPDQYCAFASKPEPKTTYICTKNCPGYGGQVA